MTAPLHPDGHRLQTPAPARTLLTLDGLPGGRAAALVVGEITDTTAPPLRRSLLAALGSSAHGLDLDLSAVAFCDIAGLHLLLDLRARALERGRTLRVTAASPSSGNSSKPRPAGSRSPPTPHPQPPRSCSPPSCAASSYGPVGRHPRCAARAAPSRCASRAPRRR
ncbi:STAS domain-containing protein [Streptomyces globosus]|uniref:STAS domain-containing protein n=1 Tax=Streptomyces globosus TaxID=68209 RepID=UPI003627FFE6